MTDDRSEGSFAEDVAPDTGRPLSLGRLIRFAVGLILFFLMWMTAGTSASAILLPARFESLWPGKGEQVLASMNAIGIFFALVANVVVGAVSDGTRSRFGRRTPFILAGGPVAAVGFWMTSISTSVVGTVFWWSILQIGLNVMLAPAAAILSDRIPRSRRATISAFYGSGQIVGASLGSIFGSAFIDRPVDGFAIGTLLWLVSGIVTVIVLPKEKPSMDADHFDALNLLRRFRPPVKGAGDFWLALCGRALLIFGYNMIVGFQLLICMKYINLSKNAAAHTVSLMATITMVISLVVSLLSGFLSDTLGVRKIPIFVASVLIAIGISFPWLFRTSWAMLAFAAIAGLGYGIYMAVDQALNVDVLPNPSEAGKDLGILNLANTLGQIVAPLVTAPIVASTGSYFMAFPVAMVMVIMGAVLILFIRKAK